MLEHFGWNLKIASIPILELEPIFDSGRSCEDVLNKGKERQDTKGVEAVREITCDGVFHCSGRLQLNGILQCGEIVLHILKPSNSSIYELSVMTQSGSQEG